MILTIVKLRLTTFHQFLSLTFIFNFLIDDYTSQSPFKVVRQVVEAAIVSNVRANKKNRNDDNTIDFPFWKDNNLINSDNIYYKDYRESNEKNSHTESLIIQHEKGSTNDVETNKKTDTSNKYTLPPLQTTTTWEELDKRIVPSWYDEAKIGIFIHWGVFSVPSFRSEWFWKNWQDENDNQGPYHQFVQRTEKPGFSYTEYANRFTAEFYDPDQWAELFAQSGAQYVVLTSKHHDGYCNWNSTDIHTTWNWNVMDVGPRRDILGELSMAVKRTMSPYTGNGLKWGIYHSLFEWYNPMYVSDKANQFQTNEFVTMKTIPELYDLVKRYEPELIWSDGEWEANSTYWNSLEFLNWYATQSNVATTAVYNDRWGKEIRCHHGSFLTCDDRYNPGTLQQQKFENAFTIDRQTWGYSRVSNYSDYLTIKELIHTIIEVVAFNGNVLINIGPAPDGTIHPIFVDRLLGIGDWLRINGNAIYKTRPWDICQNETSANVYYTTNIEHSLLYVLFTKWPNENFLQLNCNIVTSANSTVRFLGIEYQEHNNELYDERFAVTWNSRTETTNDNTGIDIILPSLTPEHIPCQHAWVISISNVLNLHSVD